jgi:anaerobic selenocysteine-containing dehydrogenase
VPSAEAPDQQFPLVLTTGRLSSQWHTRTKTGLVPQLNKVDTAPFLEMHPEDAAALALVAGQRVEIRSRRGSTISALKLNQSTPIGTVFMPIHWNDLWGESASPNEATTDAADPVSHQPALKQCAVCVKASRSFERFGSAIAEDRRMEMKVIDSVRVTTGT